MKVVHYGEAGCERPGLLDAQGRVRELSAQVADIDGRGIVNLPTVMLDGPMNTSALDFPSYRGYRFPATILSHCVWLYFRFSLSYRDVEELMAQRGIVVSHDTVRERCHKSSHAETRTLERNSFASDWKRSAVRAMGHHHPEAAQLCSAKAEVMPSVEHQQQGRLNNRAETPISLREKESVACAASSHPDTPSDSSLCLG